MFNMGFIIFIVFITMYYSYHVRFHYTSTYGLATYLLKQSNCLFLKTAYLSHLKGLFILFLWIKCSLISHLLMYSSLHHLNFRFNINTSVMPSLDTTHSLNPEVTSPSYGPTHTDYILVFWANWLFSLENVQPLEGRIQSLQACILLGAWWIYIFIHL